MGLRQLILASQPALAIASGALATLTFVASEPGTAALRDMVIECMVATQTIDVPLDVGDRTGIFSITLNDSVIVVKGGATAVAPASAFSSTRRGNWFNLPDVRMKEGSRLVITLETNAIGAATTCIFGGIPFTPDRFRGRSEPQISASAAEVILAAVPVAVVDVTDTAVVATSSNNGWLNKSGIVAFASQAIVANLPPSNMLFGVQLRQMVFRDDYNIIVGQTGADGRSAPLSMFNPHRSFNFVNLGWDEVSTDNTLTLTVRSQRGANLVECGFALPQRVLGDSGLPPQGDQGRCC